MLTTATAACPDGVTFCTGDPDTHADPREHHHQGREHSLSGSYLEFADGIMAFHLSQLDDDTPSLLFQADGIWPQLSLPQVDELISDETVHLIALRADRRRLADLLTPACTGPIDETDDEQTSHAAFSLAADALQIALAKSPDRASTLRALRALYDVHVSEARS
ncbi:hypothetical protein ACIQCF_04660 [Streptomyces sp. NPDC088353]|uniref:hypothetical protein n=1 Tax=Streptomyces sp. NPDC088353 TaxID=3365855 RepID=UPI00382EEF0C